MLLRDPRLAVARPDFYRITLEVVNGLLIPDNILTSRYVGSSIKATITWVGPSGCTGGTCWTEIEVKGVKEPFITGTLTKTLYCVDPFLNLSPEDIEYPKPVAYESCSGQSLAVQYVGDWIDIYDCDLGLQDTAKIIYREWATTSSEGIRKTAFDTLIVLRIPPMTAINTWCQSIDTVYCGASGPIGPYMVLPDVDPDDGESDCDTIYFLNSDGEAVQIPGHCGLLVHVEKTHFASDGCASTSKYVVELKQSCYGVEADGTCMVNGRVIEINGTIGEELYAVCDFWLPL